MTTWAIDVGNTAIKCAEAIGFGRIGPVSRLPARDHDWDLTIQPGDRFVMASVNPPVAESLARWIGALGAEVVGPYRSASDVPVPHRLTRPEATGADRALIVLAALGPTPKGRPMVVASCGTAITVERVAPDGVWEGGAIAPGASLMARAMAMGTAQLPEVRQVEGGPVPAWGDSTEPALRAGAYWGTVGALRELIARSGKDWDEPPLVVLTGGDAEWLAPHLGAVEVMPDLALKGLTRLVP